MKHVLSAVFLAVFGLAISASAGGAEVQMSEQDLEGLEQLLKETTLETQSLSDDDFDDAEDGLSKRRWNPLGWIWNQFKNKCVCQNTKCDCCVKLKLFNKNVCFSSEVHDGEQKMQISFTIDEKPLVNKQFELNRNHTVCGNVPVPMLSFMKYCFNQESEVDANGVVTSCSNVEFKVGWTTGAVIQFKCLEYKEGKFTFGGYKKLEKSAMLTLQAKEPFKAAIAMVQKVTGKKN